MTVFVTVGTHEQGMERLFRQLDEIGLEDTVVAQIGYSKYVPRTYYYHRFLSTDELERYMSQAQIIITHGGPGSIFQAISFMKKPIVVPRRKCYHEHVNDHQVEFARFLEGKGYIDVVNEMEQLYSYIKRRTVEVGFVQFDSNNERFCELFGEKINELMCWK